MPSRSVSRSVFRSAAMIALMTLSAGLAGCKTTLKERLEGRWEGTHVENFHPSQHERAEGWAKGTAFVFKGSRVTVSIPAESPRQGTYKLTALSENDLKVTFLRTHGAKDEAEFQFEGEDGLRWKLGDGRSVMMRKVAD